MASVLYGGEDGLVQGNICLSAPGYSQCSVDALFQDFCILLYPDKIPGPQKKENPVEEVERAISLYQSRYEHFLDIAPTIVDLEE